MDSYIQIKAVWLLPITGLFIALLIGLLVLCARQHKMKLNFHGALQKSAADFEQQVKKAQAAVAAKSDFLSRMSHEIRTPLNAIIGMAQIARNASADDKITDCMDKLEDNTKHLLGIINDILDFSKLESGSLVLEEKEFSLKHDMDFIVSIFKTQAMKKDIDFRIALKNVEHDGITTDMLRLNQVLINLMSNAVKFTDRGGMIVLSIEELAHMNGESAYRFTVHDNGVGIEPEQAKKLFTPFTQANAGVTRLYGGTGLGLSISQSIVKMMGGEIELETRPGQGSVFRFVIRVPAKKNAPYTQRDRRPLAPPKQLQGKRILIVDDVEINREVVAALLDGSGLLIDTAVNGKEALDIFCSSPPFGYDLILMDMLMPVMDGCAATIEIRGSGRADAQEVKIIAMTANVLPEDMERAYQAGMNGYLTKPIELDVLYSTMEEWL